jgi:hypothetical protein
MQENNKKIEFFNLSEHFYSESDLGTMSTTEHMIAVFWHMLEMVFTYWSVSVLFILILYCLINTCIIKIPLLMFVMLFGLTEEASIQSKFWKIVFIYLAAVRTIKFLLKSVFRLVSASSNGTQTQDGIFKLS